MIKPRIVLVNKKQMKNISGQNYMGYSAYRQNKIYIRKDLPTHDRVQTYVHELGHYAFRKKGIKLGKQVANEMKRLPNYQKLKREGYKTKKIPEEILVETHTQISTGTPKQRKQIAIMKKKYPNTYRKYKQVVQVVKSLVRR